MGKRVAVTGSVQKKKSVSVIRVDTLEVLAPSIAEREAANVIGKEIELTLKDPFGTEQRLNALKGRIVLLNFWATYAFRAGKKWPDLAAIQNEICSLGVQSGRSTDEAPIAKGFAVRQGTKVNFPIWNRSDHSRHDSLRLGAALPEPL